MIDISLSKINHLENDVVNDYYIFNIHSTKEMISD
jgi:hypothetical protein